MEIVKRFWKEPVRIRHEKDLSTLNERVSYIEFDTIRPSGELVEVKEFEKAVKLVKKNFITRVIREVEQLEDIGDVVSWLKNELSSEQ